MDISKVWAWDVEQKPQMPMVSVLQAKEMLRHLQNS